MVNTSNYDFNGDLRKISQMGNYNVPAKLPAPVATNNYTQNVTNNSDYLNNNSNGQQSQFPVAQNPATGGGTSDLDRLVSAIRGQESSNNYSARNKDSGAMGAYQIMPSNLPQWSQEALGHSVSSDQFMSSPQLQDSIARYELGQYLNKYGAAGAAAAWYGGPGAVSHMNDNTPYGNYPSMKSYYEAILRRMG